MLPERDGIACRKACRREWVAPVAISAATPIVFLLIVRYEPTARDIDDGVA